MTEVEHLRRLAAVLAGALTRAWCAGSPKCRDRWERQRHPVPGDLVVEESTHYMTERGGYGERLGRLIAIRDEPIEVEDPSEWDDPLPTERCYYIALSDGRVRRWINAGFAAVPDAPGSLAAIKGTR